MFHLLDFQETYGIKLVWFVFIFFIRNLRREDETTFYNVRQRSKWNAQQNGSDGDAKVCADVTYDHMIRSMSGSRSHVSCACAGL